MTKTLWSAVVFGAVIGSGCSSPLKPIEDLRDAIAMGDQARLSGLPACEQMGKGTDLSCLETLAAALGSKNGFQAKPPDEAAAGAVAIRVFRDSRGAAIGDSPTWLSVMASAKGPGPDALRLAVARKLATNTADFAAKIDDDGSARKMLGVVGAAIPGACQLYTVLGSGVNADVIPIAEQPDHSACVQADLTRSTGPGGAYGFGTFRAAEAGLALTRDALRALKSGVSQTDARARPVLENALAAIDAPITNCSLRKVISPSAATLDESAMGHVLDGGATPLGSPASTPERDH